MIKNSLKFLKLRNNFFALKHFIDIMNLYRIEKMRDYFKDPKGLP
jgi:hypothetical protein